MDESLRRFAELYVDQRLELEKIMEALGLEKSTAKTYASRVRRYIEFATQKLRELRDSGLSYEEAVERLKQEYNLTDGIIKEATSMVGRELLEAPQAPTQEAPQQVAQPQAPQSKELEKLQREGEAAIERIGKELESIKGRGGEKEEEEESHIIKELKRYRKTLEQAARIAQLPGITPTSSTPQAQGDSTLLNYLISIGKAVEELSKKVEEGREYRGMLKRVTRPDGTVEEYEYLPEDQIKIKVYSTEAEAKKKQVDALTDKVLPEILSEIKATRADIARLGERFLSILETYVVPKLHRLHPALESMLPITVRTPEQRERELEEIERRVEAKPEKKESERK
jgi:hypothetical protein